MVITKRFMNKHVLEITTLLRGHVPLHISPIFLASLLPPRTQDNTLTTNLHRHPDHPLPDAQ
jgi:hypothetical protein